MGLSHWWIDLMVVYLFVQGAFFTVFPEEVVLPTLGILWSQGRVSFLEGYASALIGLTLGDLILYSIGRHLGLRVLAKKPFSLVLDADTLNGALEKVKRWGDWLVFLVRFTPTVRAPMFFASGVSKMPVLRFLRSDLAGLLLWIPALMLFGRRMGASGDLDQAFRKLGLIMLVLLLVGFGVTLYRERQKRLRLKI